MRLEINAGLDGAWSLFSFEKAKEDLNNSIDNVIMSFQTIYNDITNVYGGTEDNDNLTNALNMINMRIAEESNKKSNLIDFDKRFQSFVDLAISIDRNVSTMVDVNKEKFYDLHEHLRPPFTMDHTPLYGFVTAASTFYTDVADVILDFWVEAADEILVGLIVVGSIVGGITLVASGGWMIVAGAALIGGAIGMGVAATKSFVGDNDVDLSESFKGYGFGAIAGAAFGTAMYGGIAAASLSGWKALGANFLVGFGRASSMNFLEQTVFEGEYVQGLKNFDVVENVLEGSIGGVINITMSAITSSSWYNKYNNFLTNKTKGLLALANGKFSSVVNTLQYNIPVSKVFVNLSKNTLEEVLSQTVNKVLGVEDFDIRMGISNILLGTVVDFGTDYVVNKNITYADYFSMDKVQTTKDYFDLDIDPLSRYSGLKKAAGTGKEPLKSIDVSQYADPDAFNKKLHSFVKKNDLKDKLNIVLSSYDITDEQFVVFNDFIDECDELGTDVKIYYQDVVK